MHPNQALIESFYTAFGRRDGDAMAACYHPEATFDDPVFPNLAGAEVGAMWRMLCGRAADLEIEFADVSADDATGSAKWQARYTFSATGRRVHNRIQASFRFRDGKIITHRDRFPLWAWTRMALGTPGVLLGWTPIVQGKLRRTARAGLVAFMRGDDAPAS